MDKDNVYAPPEADLITPSGELHLASRWSRFWGAMIDGIIGMAINFPLMYFTGFWGKAVAEALTVTETILMGAFGLVMFVILHGYLLAKHGQTIGKKLVGTRIVSTTSNQILPFGRLLILRYLPTFLAAQIPLVGPFLLFINYLFIFTKRKRCAHDLIAGTKVIKIEAH